MPKADDVDTGEAELTNTALIVEANGMKGKQRF
jgi:hypothetical protein